jgi:lysophospholipase L1-like esterase
VSRCIALGALALASAVGCGGCRPQPEVESASSPELSSAEEAPAQDTAEEEPPLLPVLNREALHARVQAQRSLLGGSLFEDERGQPVTWIAPQNGEVEEETDIDDDLLSSLPGSSGLGAESTAFSGRNVNGNGLGLFEPLTLPPGGRPALHDFYDALHDLREGKDPDGKVRVLVYGASHTDADVYPHYLRAYLQERFGDGGHGFVHVAKPWRWYGHVRMQVEGLDGWLTEHAQRTNGRDDGLWGLLGASLSSKSKRAWGKVSHRKGSVGSKYELYFLRQPKGGSFVVTIDGSKKVTVRTAAAQIAPGYHPIELPEGEHTIEVRPVGNGEVRMFGMTVERDQPGVVVDTLGIGGTRITNLRAWDETVWGDNVRRRNPDLVIFAYGTNSAPGGIGMADYEERVREVVQKVKRAAPDASCLLIGPGSFPQKLEDGRYGPRERVAGIIAAQSRVAAELGCAFWDLRAFMGGELAMLDWASSTPRMAKGDLVHLTRRGYVRMGMGLVDALMLDFDGDPLSAGR